MTEDNILLEPGKLWNKLVKQTQYARQCGALHSIETDYQFIEHNGISFLVRSLSNLARKEKAKKKNKHKPTEILILFFLTNQTYLLPIFLLLTFVY